jgi:hypothetical protein
MKEVYSKVYTERLDAFGNVKIPKCSPAELKHVAEKIMDMTISLDYSVGSYHSTGEFARKITVDYWDKYDGLISASLNGTASFKAWYLHATKSATIERACRWLIHNGYLILPSEIVEDSLEKEENFRNAVKRK